MKVRRICWNKPYLFLCNEGESMKKLLITDLDDTLYDWLGFFIPSFYAMVDELVKITGIDKECLLKEYKILHQQYGSVEYPFITLKLPSVLNKYQNCSEDELKEILGEAFHRFNSMRKRTLVLFDGVEKALKELSQRGITIIGYTESSQENGYYRLKRLGISKYFKHVYATRSKYESVLPYDDKIMTVESKKPDKDVLISICNRESCNTNDAIYVGDSLTKDVYMARMAGITSVWVNYPKQNNDYYERLVDITSWTDNDFEREANLKKRFIESNIKPDHIIDKFDEIIELFLDG